MRALPIEHTRGDSGRGIVPAVVSQISPQPLTGAILAVSGLLTVVASWSGNAPHTLGGRQAGLLVVLCAAVVISRFTPIHIGEKTLLYLSSIPLMLLTCAFAPAIAAGAIGVSMSMRELAACRACNNKPGTVLSQVGRWTLLGYAISEMVHSYPSQYLVFTSVAAGLLLWVGDVITCPLVFTPMTGKAPKSIIISAARQSFIGEMMQYVIGWLCMLLWLSTMSADDGWIAQGSYLAAILFALALLYLYLKGEEQLATF